MSKVFVFMYSLVSFGMFSRVLNYPHIDLPEAILYSLFWPCAVGIYLADYLVDLSLIES